MTFLLGKKKKKITKPHTHTQAKKTFCEHTKTFYHFFGSNTLKLFSFLYFKAINFFFYNET